MRVNPILGSAAQQVQKVKKSDAGAPDSEVRSDSVQISAEARNLQRASSVAPSNNSARLERLEEVKAKVAQGYYNGRQVVADVAKKIIQAFGI